MSETQEPYQPPAKPVSDTPRTDVFVERPWKESGKGCWQIADFAREMERENARMKEWIESYAFGEAGFERAEVIGNMESAKNLLRSLGHD